jgi:hypothetical protein
MRATITLTDGAGNTLFVNINNAMPPMPAERHHTWIETYIDAKKAEGMHEWHDDEFIAHQRAVKLVKDAVAMGWKEQPTMSVVSP